MSDYVAVPVLWRVKRTRNAFLIDFSGEADGSWRSFAKSELEGVIGLSNAWAAGSLKPGEWIDVDPTKRDD